MTAEQLHAAIWEMAVAIAADPQIAFEEMRLELCECGMETAVASEVANQFAVIVHAAEFSRH